MTTTTTTNQTEDSLGIWEHLRGKQTDKQKMFRSYAGARNFLRKAQVNHGLERVKGSDCQSSREKYAASFNYPHLQHQLLGAGSWGRKVDSGQLPPLTNMFPVELREGFMQPAAPASGTWWPSVFLSSLHRQHPALP